MNWDASVFISAAAGVITGSGIAGIIIGLAGRALMARIARLETKVEKDQERRLDGLSKSLGYKAESKDVERIEADLKAFAGTCQGKIVASELKNLIGWMKKCDLTLERLADETASQRSDIKHDHAYISDIAGELRAHVGSKHHG